MTNFLRRYAHKAALYGALCIPLFGCGSDPEKEYLKGVGAFDNADYRTAVECFSKVLSGSSGNIDALVMLARSEFALGNLAAAESAVKKAATTNGDDIDVIEMAAQIAFYRKDYASAVRSYARMALNSDLDPSVRSIGWTGLGIIDFVRIDANPASSRLIHEARVKFLQAIILDRRNASAHFHLGHLYRDAFHCLDAAIDEFSLFVHLEPVDNDRVKRVKNEVLPSLKDEVKKRSRLNVVRVDTVGCASMLKKGDDSYGRKKYADAVDAYAKALKCNPQSYQAALNLARSYAKLNGTRFDKERSLNAYQDACKIRPSAIATHIEAGDYAMRIGNSATAVKLYSQALASSPTSKKAVQGLIDALYKSGDVQSSSIYRGYLRTLINAK